MKTAHFSLTELTRSSTAERLGIDNTPKNTTILANLSNTMLRLEEIRQLWNKPIVITSGYRCPELNKVVGGKPNSQHLKGEAVDIKWDPELFKFIEEHCKFDQLIREKSKSVKWIHISFKQNNGDERQQVIALNV